ncbi:MAG: pyrroline-5-carboxylate reductase [Clostridium sp.]|nr:pyrroline-5-carboxylate reductase [Clostridium sp.]
MKIGFIGCGNMATAIIKGIISNSDISSENIFVYDTYKPAMDKPNNEMGVTVCDDSQAVINNTDTLFLAVKPNVLGSVLASIHSNKPLIISIAAGKNLAFLEENISADMARIVRVMPNINAMVGEAICAYCYNEQVTDEDIKTVEMLLSCFGKCLYIDESQFSIYSAIGGCAPAFAYMFIDSLARAGVKNGMKKDEALKIAAQTVYGSAKMILENDQHPWKLIDNVCSPGGTTIEGVTSLQADGFESAVHNAVQKAFEKDKRL